MRNKNKIERPNQFAIMLTMVKRNLKVYFKNVPIVIFTLMVPLAVLAVYALFLRPMEAQQIRSALEQFNIILKPEQNPDDLDFLKKIYGIADCWMMSGVLAVSCITVSLNSNYIMVKDKENDANKDMLSSPISPRTIMFSYFLFNFLVTFLVIFIVFLLCLLWLALYNAYMIDVIDFFSILGALILSVMSASLATFFIASFIKTDSVLSTIVAIFSAGIGFLIGAYLPDSMMPDTIKNLTALFPGTYSTTLLRNFFVHTPMVKLIESGRINEGFINEFVNMFGFNIKFFNIEVSVPIMWLVLFISIIIFLVLNMIFSSRNTFTGLFFSRKEKKRIDIIQKGIKEEKNEIE
ncbi:MAG: ABC transporter permease [Candidatus Enterosoma sp.]|nr:ABC transporter permease [Bacilli bacterium]MDD7607385.1 ABC transporter permease [bacterium]MDY3907288.1 ABC transporter permease [Candidatus Enterosoma sp.]MDY5865536.1 ABC transporter permease [Candidatus Enterosoma sp.]